MAMVQVNLRMPRELLLRVDEARGDVSRNLWVRRAVERALDRSGPSQGDDLDSSSEVTQSTRPRSPAPAEQPVRRVSPSGPLTLAEHNDAMLSSVPPGQSAVIPVYVSRRRDVKPFQRGGS